MEQQRGEIILQVVKLGDFQHDEKTTELDNGQNKLADNEEPKQKTFFSRFGGMLMALSASFFFSISFLIVKVLGNRGFEALGCSVLFNVGVLIPCFVGILIYEKGPRSNDRPSIFTEIWPLNVSQRKRTAVILVVGYTY